MKWQYKLLGFLNNFGLGLTAPVLSLILCQHGCSLQSIGLSFAIYSGTVILAELPSGILADLYGRKLSFIMSCILGILSAFTLLISQSFALTATAMVLSGLATAFASGSLDALAVESTISRVGEATLTKAISSLMAYQCAGLAFGALAGGLLPNIGSYSLQLLLKALICLVSALMTFILPYDIKKPRAQAIPSLPMHLGKMIGGIRGSVMLKSVVLCIVLTALVQGALEVYWQPQLIELTGGENLSVLGFLAASAYLATTAGCVVFGRFKLNKPKRGWSLYLGISGGIAALVALISFTVSSTIFSIIYITLYLLIGMLAVAEQSLVNREVSNEVRASMLSVTSFAARGGVMLSGLVSSVLFSLGDIALIWRVTASITALGLIGVTLGSFYHSSFKLRRNSASNASRGSTPS